MRYLCLDQARNCGYSVFDNGELTDYGLLDLGQKKTDVYEDILFSAQDKIEKLFDKVQADVVVVEDVQQQSNPATFKKLSMLLGSLICLFQKREILYEIVPPTRWRSFCAIKGRKRTEQKLNTICFVKKKFGIEEISEDAADAVAIGWYAVNNLKIREQIMIH